MIINYSKRFVKHLRKTPVEIQLALKKRLQIFIVNQHDPSLSNHELHGKWESCRSINITGDWRAIYRYRDEHVEWIDFVEIGTHS